MNAHEPTAWAVEMIDRPRLQLLLQSGAPPHLVHGGGNAAFRRAHLPGSVAFASITDAIRGLAGAGTVVVYGKDRHDDTSRRFAEKLRSAGVGTPLWFAGGVDEWRYAGGAVEGDQIS